MVYAPVTDTAMSVDDASNPITFDRLPYTRSHACVVCDVWTRSNADVGTRLYNTTLASCSAMARPEYACSKWLDFGRCMLLRPHVFSTALLV